MLDIFKIAAYGDGVIEERGDYWIQGEETSFKERLNTIISKELGTAAESEKILAGIIDLNSLDSLEALAEEEAKKILGRIVSGLKDLIISLAREYQNKSYAEKVREYLASYPFIFGIPKNTKEELYEELDFYQDLDPDLRRRVKGFISRPRSPIISVGDLHSYLNAINPPFTRVEKIDDLTAVKNIRAAAADMRKAQNDELRNNLVQILNAMPEMFVESGERTVYQGMIGDADAVSRKYFGVDVPGLIKAADELKINDWQSAKNTYDDELSKIAHLSETTKNIIRAESEAATLWGMPDDPAAVMAEIARLYNEISSKIGIDGADKPEEIKIAEIEQELQEFQELQESQESAADGYEESEEQAVLEAILIFENTQGAVTDPETETAERIKEKSGYKKPKRILSGEEKEYLVNNAKAVSKRAARAALREQLAKEFTDAGEAVPGVPKITGQSAKYREDPITTILKLSRGSSMIDYTSLKLSGAGVKLKTDLENDVKSIITKVSDKRMDYLTEIVKAANAEKTGVEIIFNGIADAELPDKETFMMLLALVRSCDDTGIAGIDGDALSDNIEKMVRELNNLKDDYLIVFGQEPSLYRVFHTDSGGYHDRAFTVYEKQAERIESQLKIERDDLVYEQMKLLEGIDSDKKRERCEGNIESQKEIIADLETELSAVTEFGNLRMEMLKTHRDLRWERAREEVSSKQIKSYIKTIEKFNMDKLKVKYRDYLWSYNNDELSPLAAGNEKAMKKLPDPENEMLPYVKEMIQKQKDFGVLAVGRSRLEESIRKWQSNEEMKSAKKNQTALDIESNFAEAEKTIREAIRLLGEKNENLLWKYHDAVKLGNELVEEKFASAGAGKASPKLKGAEEIGKLAQQLSANRAEVELPSIQQPASESDKPTVYLDEAGGAVTEERLAPSMTEGIQKLTDQLSLNMADHSRFEKLPVGLVYQLLFYNLKVEVELPEVQQSMFVFDDENKQKILRNLLKAAQREYDKKDKEDHIRSYGEKAKEIRDNIGAYSS
jgi:hypothetical protein